MENIDYSVTDDQKHALKEDGIVKLPGLINSSLLKELNKCFDWSISNHGPIASFTKINNSCLLYTSPSPRDGLLSRMPSSA